MQDDIEIQIPDNYKAGTNIFGISIPLFNLVQGVALFALPWIILFNLRLRLDNSAKITLSLVIGLGLGFLGMVGVEGMTLVELIKCALIFNRKKRVAYYNPRVKVEAKALTFETKRENILPRDRIVSAINKYREKNNIVKNKAAEENAEAIKDIDLSQYQFEDDFMENTK